MSTNALSLLFVEDRQSDAELVIHALRRSGLTFTWQRAENEAEFRTFIKSGFDAIVADYTLPQFGALEALRILQEMNLDIPFIVVTGTVSEDDAVQCMKLGAADYLLKDRLIRLGPAILHAMEQKRVREAKRQSEQALQQYMANLEQLVSARTAELRRTKEQVETILNNTSEAIALATFDGVIVQANAAFMRLLGEPPEHVIGQSLLILSGETDTQPFIDALRRVITDKIPTRIEIVARRNGSAPFDADIALAPVSEETRIQGIVCSMRDITERKQTEQNLRDALARERELSELKSRFTSMISHEFRTPLAMIAIAADNLNRYYERLSQERRNEHFDRIQGQIKNLASMLDDILAIDRMETPGFEFARVPVDVTALAHSLTAEMQSLVGDTHTILCETDIPIIVQGDAKLLSQALSNLISNAVKYSPVKTTVHVNLWHEGELAIVQVRDEGIGIPEKDLEHVFDAFFRAQNVGVIRGTGLGLALVKHAVDLHGGTIHVASVVNLGTTITLSFPAQETLE